MSCFFFFRTSFTCWTPKSDRKRNVLHFLKALMTFYKLYTPDNNTYSLLELEKGAKSMQNLFTQVFLAVLLVVLWGTWLYSVSSDPKLKLVCCFVVQRCGHVKLCTSDECLNIFKSTNIYIPLLYRNCI